MSFFFKNFPKVQYDANAIGDTSREKVSVQNILKRYIMKMSIVEKVTLFYEYDLKEGETIGFIADRYYGDERLDWIIYITNLILDPNFDLPLESYEFEKYISKKYGSVYNAQTTVDRYETIDEDGNRFVVDENTFNTTSELNRVLITKYDAEIQLNESKRSLLILKKEYVSKFLKESKAILND